MEENGLTDLVLIKQLKKELKAHVTKTQKLRGAVTLNELKKGIRILSTSGQIITTKDGELFGDGDTVIAWNEVDWSTRQRARMDAHKLRGDYPADKHELTGKDGQPIAFTDIERAQRLARLIEMAKERKKEAQG
jgi:hypothetical protein